MRERDDADDRIAWRLWCEVRSARNRSSGRKRQTTVDVEPDARRGIRKRAKVNEPSGICCLPAIGGGGRQMMGKGSGKKMRWIFRFKSESQEKQKELQLQDATAEQTGSNEDDKKRRPADRCGGNGKGHSEQTKVRAKGGTRRGAGIINDQLVFPKRKVN